MFSKFFLACHQDATDNEGYAIIADPKSLQAADIIAANPQTQHDRSPAISTNSNSLPACVSWSFVSSCLVIMNFRHASCRDIGSNRLYATITCLVNQVSGDHLPQLPAVNPPPIRDHDHVFVAIRSAHLSAVTTSAAICYDQLSIVRVCLQRLTLLLCVTHMT